MSEYHYNEWLAIDRPLDKQQLAEVNGLSSHMDVATATQAVVTYSWGDFKHNPHKVLASYFDAFLYTANWGSRHPAFRFPAAALDAAAIEPYLFADVIELDRVGSYQVLTLEIDNEDGGDWIDADGLLSQISGVRRQMMNGDYRALYLVWLGVVTLRDGNGYYDGENSDDNDVLPAEPPVPSGLGKLDGSLTALCEFFDVSEHLVAAAAANSVTVAEPTEAELHAKIAKLPRSRTDDYLLRLLNDDSPLNTELRRELGLHKTSSAKQANKSRTPKTLLEDAKRHARTASQRQQAQAAKARIAELEKLATREEAAWVAVITAIQKQTASAYDTAVAQLVDLRDLSQHRGDQSIFDIRLATVVEKFGNSRALVNRLKKARLLP